MKLINSKLLLSDFQYDKKYHIDKLYLNQYFKYYDISHGDYYIIKASLYTNHGNIEMTYFEGYKDKCILEDSFNFLTKYEGISNLLNRMIIELSSNSEKF